MTLAGKTVIVTGAGTGIAKRHVGGVVNAKRG